MTLTQAELVKDLERGFISGLVFAANVPDRDEEVRKAIVELSGSLDLFTGDPNRELARAILDLHEEEGDIAAVGDPIKLFPRLQKGLFDDVQHLSDYLLGDFQGAATDLVAALTEVRRHAVRRRGHMILSSCAARLAGSDSVDTIIAESIRALVDLQETQVSRKRISAVPYKDAMVDALGKLRERMDAFAAGLALPGARLGIYSVDHLFGRGLKPGTLAILAARPGCGKTALAAQWIQESVRLAPTTEGEPEPWAAFITMEMTIDELILRDFAGIANIDSQLLDKGQISEDQYEELCRMVRDVLSDRRILLHEQVRNVDDAITAIQADALRMGCAPTLVAIDYLQLFEESGKSRGNRADVLGEMTRSLKLTAKSQGTPIMLLSQLNRELERRTNKEPQLSDLRDSGAIEADGDYVMFLWSESSFATEDPAIETRLIQFSMPKNRHGSTGKTALSFRKKTTRFYALERETGSRMTSSAGPSAPAPKVAVQDPLGDC